MAFKKYNLGGATASNRKYQEAQEARTLGDAFTKQMSWSLDTGVAQRKREANFFSKNAHHELNDFIEAYSSDKEQEDRGREAVAKIATTLWTLGVQEAAKRQDVQDRNNIDTATEKYEQQEYLNQINSLGEYSNFSVTNDDGSIEYTNWNQSVIDTISNAGLDKNLIPMIGAVEEKKNKLKNVTPLEKTSVKNEDNFQAYLDITSWTKKAGGLQLANEVGNAPLGLQLFNFLDTTTANKTVKRGVVNNLLTNVGFGQGFIGYLQKSDKVIEVQPIGSEVPIQVPISSLSRFNGENSLANQNAEFMLAAIDTYAADVEQRLISILGKGEYNSNIRASVIKARSELKHKYLKSWGDQKKAAISANVYTQLKATLTDAFTNSNNPNVDRQALLSQTVWPIISTYQEISRLTGTVDYKKAGFKAAQQDIELALKEIRNSGTPIDVTALQNATIPAAAVPWVGKSKHKKIGNTNVVKISDAFPKEWSDSKWELLDFNINKEYAQREEGQQMLQLKTGIIDFQKMRSDGASQEELDKKMAELKAIADNLGTAGQTQITNLEGQENFKRHGNAGFRYLQDFFAENEFITDTQLANVDQDALRKFRAEFTEEDWNKIYTPVHPMVLVKNTDLQEVTNGLTKQIERGAGKSPSAINQHTTAVAQEWIAKVLLPEEIKSIYTKGKGTISPAEALKQANLNLLKYISEGANTDGHPLQVDPITGGYPNVIKASNSIWDEETNNEEKITTTDIRLKLDKQFENGFTHAPFANMSGGGLILDVGSNNRDVYNLDGQGRIHNTWYYLQSHPLNVPCIPIYENGMPTGMLRRMTAEEIRALTYERSKHLPSMSQVTLQAPIDSIHGEPTFTYYDQYRRKETPETKLTYENTPVQTVEGLIKQLKSVKAVNQIIKNPSNTKLLSRTISSKGAANGPTYGITRNAIDYYDTIKMQSTDSYFLPTISPNKWDRELLPFAKSQVAKRNLPGHSHIIEDLAMCKALGLNLDELDSNGLPACFNNPIVRAWRAKIEGRDLN